MRHDTSALYTAHTHPSARPRGRARTRRRRRRAAAARRPAPPAGRARRPPSAARSPTRLTEQVPRRARELCAFSVITNPSIRLNIRVSSLTLESSTWHYACKEIPKVHRSVAYASCTLAFMLLMSCLSSVCSRKRSDTARAAPSSEHASARTAMHRSFTAEQMRMNASSTRRSVVSPSWRVVKL